MSTAQPPVPTRSPAPRPPAARVGRLLASLLAGLALALPALVLAALVLPAPPASAHTALASSTPQAGASLAAAPRDVRLVFTEPVSQSLANVAVTAPSGATVTAGEPAVSGATVTQPLRPLPEAGEYVVAYRVVAADGHPVTGETRFVLTAAPTATTPAPAVTGEAATPTGPTSAPAAEPAGDAAGGGAQSAADTGGGPGLLLPLGAVVVAAVAVAGWLLTRRSPGAGRR